MGENVSTFRLNNVDIAILTKLNELAGRYGIKPYDFVATVNNSMDDITVLVIEVPVQDTPQKTRRFQDLCRMVGMGEGNELRGSVNTIIDALDEGIRNAPKLRSKI